MSRTEIFAAGEQPTSLSKVECGDERRRGRGNEIFFFSLFSSSSVPSQGSIWAYFFTFNLTQLLLHFRSSFSFHSFLAFFITRAMSILHEWLTTSSFTSLSRTRKLLEDEQKCKSFILSLFSKVHIDFCQCAPSSVCSLGGERCYLWINIEGLGKWVFILDCVCGGKWEKSEEIEGSSNNEESVKKVPNPGSIHSLHFFLLSQILGMMKISISISNIVYEIRRESGARERM